MLNKFIIKLNNKKLIIILCSGLLCFVLFAQPIQTLDKFHRASKGYSVLRSHKEKNLQAIGVILSFHKYPSQTEKNKISQTLAREGLNLTRQFKSFKSLVFVWSKLKSQRKAQNICKSLSHLKNLKYCEPDTLLSPNNTYVSETEADSPACTVDCNDQQNSFTNILFEFLRNFTSEESCELLPVQHQLKDGKLTDYWAQEMVGADLLREEIEKAKPLPEDKFLIAVFDTPKQYHNIHVQNIISHKGPQAVLPPLSSPHLQHFTVGNPSQYTDAVVSLTTKNIAENTEEAEPVVEKLIPEKLPSFINNSMTWINSQTIYTAMSRISPPSILVTSSGNHYPDSVSSKKSNFSKNFDGILVGSLSPQGEASHFSQEGEEVHILAPSDDYITSAHDDDSYKQFKGTSGSTPLVTGSLAGFEWLSGYHPTAQEAKLLLEKTAVPTVHSVFEDLQKNGVGMLNAYKLGRLAQRLKDKCDNDADCFKKEIRNSKNYEFSVDEDLLTQVQSAFPKCSGRDDTKISCTDKKSALKKLRQAVLLDVENMELWEQLRCIYEQEGFSENALGVERTLSALKENKDFLNDLETLFNNNSRLFTLINREKRGVFLNDLLDNNPTADIKRKIIFRAGEMENPERNQLLQQLTHDEDPDVRETIAQNVGEMNEPERTQISLKLAHDESPKVREALAFSARELKEPERTQLLRQLAHDDNPNVRRAVPFSARELKEPERTQLLQQLAQDESSKVREAVPFATIEMDEPERTQLLQQLAHDESPNVRINVVSTAGGIGCSKGIPLLQHFSQDTHPDVRKQVVETAVEIECPERTQILLKLAQHDENPHIQDIITWKAYDMKEPERTQIFKQITQNEYRRKLIAQEIIQMEESKRTQLLQHFAQHDDSYVRATSAVVAGAMGGPEGFQTLQQLAQDKDPFVREAVVSGANELKEPERTQLLQQFSQHDDPNVSEQAIEILRRTNSP